MKISQDKTKNIIYQLFINHPFIFFRYIKGNIQHDWIKSRKPFNNKKTAIQLDLFMSSECENKVSVDIHNVHLLKYHSATLK